MQLLSTVTLAIMAACVAAETTGSLLPSDASEILSSISTDAPEITHTHEATGTGVAEAIKQRLMQKLSVPSAPAKTRCIVKDENGRLGMGDCSNGLLLTNVLNEKGTHFHILDVLSDIKSRPLCIEAVAASKLATTGAADAPTDLPTETLTPIDETPVVEESPSDVSLERRQATETPEGTEAPEKPAKGKKPAMGKKPTKGEKPGKPVPMAVRLSACDTESEGMAWKVRKDGLIRSVAHPKLCLTHNDSHLELSACQFSKKDKNQKWKQDRKNIKLEWEDLRN